MKKDLSDNMQCQHWTRVQMLPHTILFVSPSACTIWTTLSYYQKTNNDMTMALK